MDIIKPTKFQSQTSLPRPANESSAKASQKQSMRTELIFKPSQPVKREDIMNTVCQDKQMGLKPRLGSVGQDASISYPQSPKTETTQVDRQEQAYRFEDKPTTTGEKEQKQSRYKSRTEVSLITPEMIAQSLHEKSGLKWSTQKSSCQKDAQTKLYDDSNSSSYAELFKSSEPVYDEMVGGESVKDRLQKYKSIVESNEDNRAISSAKTVISKQSDLFSNQDSTISVNENGMSTDVIRSPPAGTREQPNYIPSFDLNEAKALYEILYSNISVAMAKPNTSTSRSNSSSSPSFYRTNQSPSHYSSCKSPTYNTDVQSDPILPAPSEMSDVVKPPPAGTKETVDCVPSVKLSCIKSVFEAPETAMSHASTELSRTQFGDRDWENKMGIENTEVVRGSFCENTEGITRPLSKQGPPYNQSSDLNNEQRNSCKATKKLLDNETEVSPDLYSKAIIETKPKDIEKTRRSKESIWIQQSRTGIKKKETDFTIQNENATSNNVKQNIYSDDTSVQNAASVPYLDDNVDVPKLSLRQGREDTQSGEEIEATPNSNFQESGDDKNIDGELEKTHEENTQMHDKTSKGFEINKITYKAITLKRMEHTPQPI